MSKPAGGEANSGLSPDFLDFIVCLNERHVDFVLVGGYAMGVHGVVRATGDIDFLYRRTAKNVHELCAAMHEFGAPREVIDQVSLMTSGIVTQFGNPPNRIDLLNAIDGVSFLEVWNGATTATLDDEKIRVIGLRELKKNKNATGRKKDEEDMRRLTSQKTRKKR
jgi:hypothetical protein